MLQLGLTWRSRNLFTSDGELSRWKGGFYIEVFILHMGLEKKSSSNREKQRGLQKQGVGPIAQRKVPTQRKGTRGKQVMSKSLPLSMSNTTFVVDAKHNL